MALSRVVGNGLSFPSYLSHEVSSNTSRCTLHVKYNLLSVLPAKIKHRGELLKFVYVEPLLCS